MSTPITLAAKYCANWQQDGVCSGLDFRNDGTLFRFRNEGCQCGCLLKAKERCSYFESAVLPMGDSEEWRKKYPAEARVFQEGADRYMRRHSGIAGLALKARVCPDCGTQIGPRKRYCHVCSDARQQQTDRNYHREKRTLCLPKGDR
jgi:hypothetical protein